MPQAQVQWGLTLKPEWVDAAIQNGIKPESAEITITDDDVLVTSVLQKMAKQRRESIEMYDAGGREELAAVERAELAVIEEFLEGEEASFFALTDGHAITAFGSDGPKAKI